MKKMTLKWSMIRRDFFRHWPIWTISFLIYLFNVCLINLAFNIQIDDKDLMAASVNITGSLTETTAAVSYAMGLAASWAAFGFLGKKRKHYFYEALPFNKTSLFANRYIFGFLACMIPCVAIFFVELFQILFLCGTFEIAMLIKWFIAAFCEHLFWYSFGVLIFTLCGRVIMGGFCYLFFSVVGFVMDFYLEICSDFCFIGYNSGFLSGRSLFGILSPCEYLFSIGLDKNATYENASGFTDSLFSDGSVSKLCVAAVVGVGLTVLAYYLYRRRRTENTGDTVVFNGMKLVFCWISSFIGAITLSLILFAMLFYQNDAIAHRASDRIRLVIILAIVGFVLYLVSCMIVEKRFRVFKKNYVKALVFTAALVFFGIAYLHDAFNIESCLPASNDIKNIYMNNYDSGFGTYLYKDRSGSVSADLRDDIEIVRGMHEIILENMEELEDIYNKSGLYSFDTDRDYYQINISYTLKNGSRISRSYRILKGGKLDDKLKEYIINNNISFGDYNEKSRIRLDTDDYYVID